MKIPYYKLLLFVLLIVGCWMDADQNGLNNAAYHGDIETFKRLINDGKNVYGKGWDGDTPLANAIRGEHPEIIILLLNAGADINNKFVRNALYETKVEILIILCSYDDEYSCNQANPNSTS